MSFGETMSAVAARKPRAIPFLGIPVLNRGDLLERCLDSIDCPVDRIVVLNNGNDPSVESYTKCLKGRLQNFELIRPARNLGVAGSWNYFLRNYEASYHLICGSDIKFAAGDLEKINDAVVTHPDHAIIFGNHGYSIFALTKRGVDLVGYFDENFYPAYLEDCDHFHRLRMLGGKSLEVPDTHAVHGEPPHWGSSTILSNAVYRERNGVTHGNNFTYYRAKWGGINGHELYAHPFNDPTKSPQFWELNQDLRRANDIWDA